MKVILTQDVKGLGDMGTVQNVSDGYARNYLIPKGLAQPASEGVLKQVELSSKAHTRREKRLLSEAEELAAAINRLELHFKAKAGENDRLYGSITSGDIAEAIKAQLGAEVDKRKVILEDPIRQLGQHTVQIRLMSDVIAEAQVIVEKEEKGEKGE